MTQWPEKPRMRAILYSISGGGVLNIGCVGHDAYRNPNKDWLHGYLDTVSDELVGIDIDEEGIEDLQTRGYDVRLGDAEKLDAVSGPFDYVVAGEVIEHLSNPGKLFEATRGVLTDNGCLILTTPNPWSIVYIRRAMTGDPVGNDEHTCWIDETTLRELAGRYGYEGYIDYLKPMSVGLASVCYKLGHKRFGGTRLYAQLYPGDGE